MSDFYVNNIFPQSGVILKLNDIEVSTNGTENINLGNDSGQAITTGIRNVSLGDLSLNSNISSNDNVAIGNQSLELSTQGGNTAVGSWALKKITSGSQNDSLGAYSLSELTSGNSNVSLGSSSGFALLSGDKNTFVGNQAGSMFTSSANKNVVLGSSSGYAGSGGSGDENIFIGNDAGYGYSSGDFNVVIGSYPNVFGTITGNNNIQIGRNSNKATSNASNSITLGNSSHTVIRAAVTTITSLSDERDKKDIKDLSTGLEFVEGLRPVEFTWNDRDENGKHDISDFGFIAQDLKKAQEDAEKAEVLKLVYEENPEKLEASYGKLIPILVKAIQELSEEVKQLKTK
jgi:hypothetical protein